MKNSILVLIISTILIFLLIFLYRLNIDKNSVLTCTRINDDVAVIKFNRDGIESLKINGENVSDEEFILYQANFTATFSWIKMNEENYTELELIHKYMEKVSNYERNNEEYNSVCVQK